MVYYKKRPRSLTPAQRLKSLRRYASDFERSYLGGELSDECAKWRSDRSANVQRLLAKNVRRGLSRPRVEELLWNLNCMSAHPVNITRALENNSLPEIRDALRHLVDEDFEVERRMADCERRLSSFGKSTVQELIGFNYPGRYPLRNLNTNCGLRFFGYDVRVK